MTDETTRDIAEIKATLGRQDERINALADRMDKQDRIIETVNQLTISVGRIADGLDTIKRDVTGMRCDIDDLKNKPAKRWEGIVTVAITAVVSAAITYILTQAGLK